LLGEDFWEFQAMFKACKIEGLFYERRDKFQFYKFAFIFLDKIILDKNNMATENLPKEKLWKYPPTKEKQREALLTLGSFVGKS